MSPSRAKRTRAAAPKPTPFDPTILKQSKPEKKYSLAKVLAAPRQYAGRLVVPTGMFNLTPAASDNPHGQRKYLIFERRMAVHKDSLGITSVEAQELEVEPAVARRLDALGSQRLSATMSLLTLWFPSEGGNALIVQVDVLRYHKLGFKKATFLPEGDIDYHILRITPLGQIETIADDREWEEVERFAHFANNYKKRVRAYKKMLQTGQMEALNSAMGSLYQGMLKSAAANELQQQILRRGVGGKF